MEDIIKYNHRDLCLKAAKYLKNEGIVPFYKCQYVVCELERCGECPDAFGIGDNTQLIEVKVSRSDFLSDKNKYWRKNPEFGLGQYRSYLCPEGLINVEDLPNNWGLLWINDKGKITKICNPIKQEHNNISEMKVLTSILRREGIKPQIFNYKKYKNEIN